MNKKQSLSYVELSEVGCDSIVLINNQIREDVHGGAGSLYLTKPSSKEVAQKIIQLFESVAVKKKSLHRHLKEYKQMDYIMCMSNRGFCVEKDYIVPTSFVIAFVSMYQALSDATKGTYKAGLSRGKSLLQGLNDGTYTMKDFERFVGDDDDDD